MEEGALEDDAETLELAMDEDNGEDAEETVLETLELLETLEDVVESKLVEVAVLIQEQPLETLVGDPAHAVVTQAGKFSGFIAAV